MTVEALRTHLKEGRPVEMLDVREAHEYGGGEDAIPGSKNVPMGQVFVDAMQGTLPKDRKIVTICKTGSRCAIVADELKKKGYDIEHLEGGLNAWHQGTAA